MKQTQQTTLRAAVSLSGVGVHSGDEVKMTLHPAEAGHGVAFSALTRVATTGSSTLVTSPSPQPNSAP